jgi:hypothetical protein
MFLIYLEEYCTRYCPLVLYGKNRWTEVGDVLSAPGPYYSYVTPKCDKNFKDNANKHTDFTNICYDQTIAEYEKKSGREVERTVHNS